MGAWIQWILCILMSLLLMLYLDASAGGFLLAFFILSGIFSAAEVLLFRKNIKASISVDSTLTEQGEDFVLTAIIERTGALKLLKLFPVPFVSAYISNDGGLYGEKSLSFTASPGWSGKMEIVNTVKGLYSGKSVISLDKVVLRDFLGLFKASVPLEIGACKIPVSVLPKSCELKKGLPIMREIAEKASFSDNENDGAVLSVGAGTPGYESREYQPGDSMNRVNWKLSARKDGFWVRKEDFAAKTSQAFVVDSALPDLDSDSVAAAKGLLLETILSVGSDLLKQDIPVELYFAAGESWETVSFSGRDDIPNLRITLAGISLGGKSRFPLSVPKDSAVLLFTLCPDFAAEDFVKGFLASEGFSSMIFSGGAKASGWRAIRGDGEISLAKGGLDQ